MSLRARLLVLLSLAALPAAGDRTWWFSPAEAADDPAPPPRPDGRLPPGVRPTRYALELSIDPSRGDFSGRARIGVTIERPTRAIVMHARSMTIRSAWLLAAGHRLAATPRLRMAAGSKGDPEELTLTFDQTVPAGEAELDIEYQAPFAEGLRGLYRVQQDGAWYAYTQFEPNDARRAFPCFDEPGWKTPVELAIRAPAGAIAVANMREAQRRAPAPDGSVIFEFERSPPLPTYLVAFAVGPLEILEGAREPVAVRLIATRGRASLGRLAVAAAAEHLALLARYFDRPYPYSKLDIVAVPSFGAGAMENPGLVTFREELLLLDPRRTSTAARRAMASVLAHELSHLWFGDLVTMAWWDDLWLNEAFASWMSDKIIDQWHPETQAVRQALAGKSRVMAEDALATARKVRNPVRSSGEAREAFDGITYAKGRAVLAMTETWLGEETFRDGIRRYLRRHAWGNATAADLYAALAEATAARAVGAGDAKASQIAPMMNSFTDQAGVPLVGATLSCQAGTGGSIQLRQQEYLTLERRQDPAASALNKLWRIPVCVTLGPSATSSGAGGGAAETPCALLASAASRIDLPAPAGPAARCPRLFYPNAGEAGYYRLRFEPEQLAQLAQLAKSGQLLERERFGLASNAWAAVGGGDLSTSALLDLYGGFAGETSRLVWEPIMDALLLIDRALVSDAAHPAFTRWVRALLGPAGRRLGWRARPGEGDEPKLLRELVLGALGGLGEDRSTLAQARRFTDQWLADPPGADADRARIALPLAAKRGDAKLFDRLVAALTKAGTPEVRVLALSGLAGFEDPALVERTLALTLDGTIRTQDLRYVFAPLAWRRATRDVTIAWIQRNFDGLMHVVPATQVGRIIHVAGAMCDADRVRDVETFLRPRVERIEGTAKDLRQALEEARRCASLAEKERDPTSRWLMRESGATR
jgi:alanyl aminopeptidase